jgi:integrase
MGGSVLYQKAAKRWFIQVYWQKEKVRIWKHPVTQEPFFDKRAAEKHLARLQTEIDNGEFHPKFWKPDSPLLLPAYAKAWLDTKDVTEKTRTGYRTAINKYIEPFFKGKDIRHIRAGDLSAFKVHLGKILEPKGVYNTVSVLKTLFKDAYANEDITRVPPFPKLSLPEKIPEYIHIEEQETILSHIPLNHRPIFQFGMEYGLRVGEVRALQKDCIKGGKLMIKRAFSDNLLKDTKTNTWREYDLTPYALEILDSMAPTLSPFVFTRADGMPYTDKNLNEIWHSACEAAGIHIKLYNAFRHSLGCQLLDLGYDMDLVRQQLGHKNATMTKRYARRSNPVLAKALENRRKGTVVQFPKRESN